MNLLYGCICSSQYDETKFFSKKHSTISKTDKIKKLTAALVGTADTAQLLKLATVVCHIAICSCFADLILLLDNNNTYMNLSSPTSVMDGNCASLLRTAADYNSVFYLLDNDIRLKIVLSTTMLLIAAISLQLLREIAKGL